MPQAVFAAAGFTAVQSFLLSAAATTALSIGVSALQTALNKPKRQDFSSGILSANERTTQKQPAPSARIIVGRDKVSGSVFFQEQVGPYWTIGLVIADHEIEGVEKIILAGKEFQYDPGGVATTAPFRNGTTVYAEVSIQKGKKTQGVDPLIIKCWEEMEADDPSYTRPSYWQDFKGVGCATAVFRLYGGQTQSERDSVFPDELEPQFFVKGAKIFDPRDKSQVFGNEDTYKWSDNPTLIKAWLWMHSEDGLNASYDEIDWNSVKAAANEDDKLVSTGMGTEKRYTCNGHIKSDQDVYPSAGELSSSNGHTPVRFGGKWHFASGVDYESEMTLTDDDIRGGIEFSYLPPQQSAKNTLKTIMIHTDLEYTPSAGPTAAVQEYIDADGGENSETIELGFTNSWSMAYRLTQIDLKRRRQPILKAIVDLRFIRAVPGTVIDVQLEEYPAYNGRYICSDFGFEPSGDGLTCTLELRGYSEDIFAFDPNDIPEKPVSEVSL